MIFLLLFGSFAVAVTLPVQDWVPVESLVEPPGERNPLLEDLLPMQGHVVQEDTEPVVGVKPAELNPVQQNQQVKSKILLEDVPVVRVMEEKEKKGEPVMNEPRQVEALLNMMVLKMAPEYLPAEEPEMEQQHGKNVEDDISVLQEETSKKVEELVMGLEPQEKQKPEEHRNILQEEELFDAVEPTAMELDPVPEAQEVHSRNPNRLLKNLVMEQEPEKEDTFVEDENALQEEASVEGEELVMGLEPQEKRKTELDRKTLQEEELIYAVEPPAMELDPVPEAQVHPRNPDRLLKEPGMEQESEKEDTFVEDENALQEEASVEGEELVMGLEPQEALTEKERNILQEQELLTAVQPPVMELDLVPEPHEVHQRNPNEFVGEPVMRQPGRTFVDDEDSFNFMREESLMEKPEGATMLEFGDPDYYAALNSVLEYEPSQDESLMQFQLQQGKKSEDSNKMEYLPGEEDLMMADQAYLDESLMNQNARKKREDNEVEPSDHDPSSKGWRSCSGVVIDGKCYVYFRGPKKASEAEFFCQNNYRRGHLASVTSRYIHDQVMGLMDQNGGRRRTWIGGLRYLDTGRWIWLDGARWVYADWLPGEPNNTAGVENCLEILSNGKFNDMPCWDLRAFICSYPF